MDVFVRDRIYVCSRTLKPEQRRVCKRGGVHIRVISPDVVQPAMPASSSKSVARRSNSDFQRAWKSSGGAYRFVHGFSRLARRVYAIERCANERPAASTVWPATPGRMLAGTRSPIGYKLGTVRRRQRSATISVPTPGESLAQGDPQGAAACTAPRRPPSAASLMTTN